MQSQALLDDHIVKAQSMRASPFLKPLEAEALDWEALLVKTQVCVCVCVACMRVGVGGGGACVRRPS